MLGGSKLRRRETVWGIIFVLPGVIFFSAIYIYPILQSLYFSFHDWNLLNPPRFIGLANYQRLFADTGFVNALQKSLIYSFGTAVPIWVIALGLATVFQKRFQFRRVFLGVYYVPAVVSLTVWTLLWLLMYNPRFGLLTLLTEPLGFEYIRWLNNPNLAMPSIILLSIIKGTPIYMIIFLAGLNAIPKSYLEAAQIDGATGWQLFWHITLPLLKPVTQYVTIISLLVAFQQFVPFYVLTNGGPGSATRVAPLFIFQNAFEFFRMGYASAAAVVFLVVLLAITALLFWTFSSRRD